MKTYYKKVYPSGDVEAIADYFSSLGPDLWKRYDCSWGNPSGLDASGRVLYLSHHLRALYRGSGLFYVRIYNDSSNHLVVESFPSEVIFGTLLCVTLAPLFFIYYIPLFPVCLLFFLMPLPFFLFAFFFYKMHYKSFEKDLSGIIKEEPIQTVSKWKLRP
ncbi:MAG: hypothetical protein VZQ98_10850 [Bacteroidales bacterium]|nr:hypothetical protein [Bacteroidales bacterium]